MIGPSQGYAKQALFGGQKRPVRIFYSYKTYKNGSVLYDRFSLVYRRMKNDFYSVNSVFPSNFHCIYDSIFFQITRISEYKDCNKKN